MNTLGQIRELDLEAAQLGHGIEVVQLREAWYRGTSLSTLPSRCSDGGLLALAARFKSREKILHVQGYLAHKKMPPPRTLQ